MNLMLETTNMDMADVLDELTYRLLVNADNRAQARDRAAILRYWAEQQLARLSAGRGLRAHHAAVVAEALAPTAHPHGEPTNRPPERIDDGDDRVLPGRTSPGQAGERGPIHAARSTRRRQQAENAVHPERPGPEFGTRAEMVAIGNVPSPPVVRMLQEYLPTLPVRASFAGEVRPPSGRILGILKKALTMRNEAAHVDPSGLHPNKVQEVIDAVADVLQMCDYYAGHSWALEYLSQRSRSELGLDQDRTPVARRGDAASGDGAVMPPSV